METEQGKLLGVDFGLRRVGLAVCDGLRMLATPLPAFHTKSMRESIDKVAAVAAAGGVCGIVVGLPLNMDGSESVQSGRARAFARNIEKVTGLKTELVDERLTTVEADALLAEAGVKRSARAELIDSMSAKVILQSYIDNKKVGNEMANEEEKNVELIDDETITLYDDDGKPVKFCEVACVEYQGEFYAFLQPVEKMEGVEEDDAFIFKVREEDEETDVFEPVTDDSIREAVFNEYLNAVAEAESGCDCDCNCDCDHDCCDDDECDCDREHGHDGRCGCGCEHGGKK